MVRITAFFVLALLSSQLLLGHEPKRLILENPRHGWGFYTNYTYLVQYVKSGHPHRFILQPDQVREIKVDEGSDLFFRVYGKYQPTLARVVLKAQDACQRVFGGSSEDCLNLSQGAHLSVGDLGANQLVRLLGISSIEYNLREDSRQAALARFITSVDFASHYWELASFHDLVYDTRGAPRDLKKYLNSEKLEHSLSVSRWTPPEPQALDRAKFLRWFGLSETLLSSKDFSERVGALVEAWYRTRMSFGLESSFDLSGSWKVDLSKNAMQLNPHLLPQFDLTELHAQSSEDLVRVLLDSAVHALLKLFCQDEGKDLRMTIKSIEIPSIVTQSLN